MNPRIIIIVVAVLLATATSQAANAANETRIRQASQNTVVIGYHGERILFTTTGYLNDQVFIFNRFGLPVVQGTIGQLRTHPDVRAVVQHSGGQTSLRWRLRPGGMNGGIVHIARGSQLIDSDPVVIH